MCVCASIGTVVDDKRVQIHALLYVAPCVSKSLLSWFSSSVFNLKIGLQQFSITLCYLPFFFISSYEFILDPSLFVVYIMFQSRSTYMNFIFRIISSSIYQVSVFSLSILYLLFFLIIFYKNYSSNFFSSNVS